MIWKLFKDGELVNTIVADKAFAMIYAEEMGYTVEQVEEPEPSEPIEEEPTQLDRIEAQVTYTAMMTDTLLEV